MRDITVRQLVSKLDLEKFKGLHNLLFKNTDMSHEWMTWYFDDIGGKHKPNHATRVWGMFDRDLLIGSWCVEPKDLVLDDGLIKVGRCFSVGIHPDYRRQNLFVELSKYAIAQERELGKYEYILGFPQQGRPVIEAHYKSGWSKVQDITMWSYRPMKESVKASRSQVREITNFQSCVQRPASFSETADYRNCKWLYHPDNHYICLELRHPRHNAISHSYVVMKPYGDSCHILDINGNEPVHTAELLEASKSLAYRHKWHELTMWHADNESNGLEPGLHGFVPETTRGSSITLIAVNINAKNPLAFDRCHFQMGVEEIY